MAGSRRLVGVIDDDPSVGKALLRLFRTAGLEVSVFASAEEFLANPNRDDFACLVLDVGLPGMSGLELQEQLHTAGAVPIVVITAHANEEVRHRALGGGAVAFFLKPFDNRKLLEAAFRALGADGI